MEIKIKQHDTKGKFTDALTLDGIAVNLTGHTVSFLLKNNILALKKTATITDAPNGKVEYQPVADDVANTGLFQQEWEVLFADGSILTFPNDSYNTVTILRDLG